MNHAGNIFVTRPELRNPRNGLSTSGDNRMNHFCRIPCLPAVALSVVALLFNAGCGNLFIPKQKVLVDAISAPGAVKPSGQSYRLVARKSVVTGQTAQLPVIAACLNAALTTVGMFEAPSNAPSDLFIEVTYGMDTTGRVDPSTRESFLQLSARANRAHSMETSHEEELWDVRVAVAGVAGRLESAMPLLCQVASTYAGTDTRFEATIQVPQNSPAVMGVREAALKILDAKAPNAPPPTAATESK